MICKSQTRLKIHDTHQLNLIHEYNKSGSRKEQRKLTVSSLIIQQRTPLNTNFGNVTKLLL